MLHIAMFIWLYRVPLKQKEDQYRTLMLQKMNGNCNQSFSTTERKTVDDHIYNSRDFTLI